MIKSKQFIVIAFLLGSFFVSCNGTDNTGTGQFAPPLSAVIITTNIVSSITSVSAVAGGSIINAGGVPITGRGICFSTNPNPTIADSFVTSSSDSTSFSVNITGLTLNTNYYVRAYVTVSTGTAYGNQQTFKTSIAIGQNYQGGVVFYLDNTGEHGLVVAAQDEDSAAWGCPGTLITGADGTIIGTGAQNTTNIVGQCPSPGVLTAAGICDTLNLNAYSDWFLPSYLELQQLYQQRRAVGGTFSAIYWTSSQDDANNAYAINFTVLNEGPIAKNTVAHVRAIRAF